MTSKSVTFIYSAIFGAKKLPSMKKIALSLAFFVFFSLTLSAQNAPSFRFGVQTSPVFSWMKTTDKKIEGAGTNLGLKVGAAAEYYFQPNYAIVTGLGFGLNQGGTLQNGYPTGIFWNESELSEPTKFDTLPVNAKLHYRVNYVEIPFGLKMRGGTNEDARFRFYAELPVFTLGFVTKATGDIRGTNSQNTEDEDIRDDVNGLSLSWGLGGGIEYEIATSTTLVAGLAYQQQFTDLTGDKGFVLKNNTFAKEKSKGTFGLIALRLGVFF
jgi:opacity protein-like surface antigen